ncbi:hypothetical protein WA588_001163, partial [Blastocystis sp. NMH]
MVGWEKNVSLYDYSRCDNQGLIDVRSWKQVLPSSLDVTLVIAGSMNRLVLLPLISQRWEGPLVFALHLLEENRTALESFLKSNKNASLCSNRVTILALVATPTSFFHSHFPINILRNIGIRNAQTSHFLYLDTDIMILPQTYPELKQLLSSFRNDSRTVVVFPVFFSTTGTVPKGSLETQLFAGVRSMPQNPKQLGYCILNGNCSSRKPFLFTHNYVPRSYVHGILFGMEKPFYEYTCWRHPFQEPYLVVRRDQSMPLFDEAFVDYGMNKIVYVESLRLMGYHFVLAGRVFGYDLPHSPSVFEQQHRMNKTRATHVYAKQQLIALINQTRGKASVLPLCEPFSMYSW